MARVNKTGVVSAGILLFRQREGRLELLLAHQGGPFWKTKDAGHWTIPKGEAEPGEALLDVARREFAEEVGIEVEIGDDLPLGEITQKSGKVVVAWGVEGDLDPALAHSNTFSMEWPPRSGPVRGLPRDRSGRVVRSLGGSPAAEAGAGAVHRPAGGAARA